MPTLSLMLKEATATLAPVTETPRLDAELLLAAALDISRAFLLGRLRDELTAPPLFKSYLERRLNHEPIAYILGHWEFFSLDFAIRAPILVPRPETEHLVELALETLAQRGGSGQVLDLCTGSGCVALAVAKNAPQANVCATDISEQALALAEENRLRHHTALPLYQGNLFQALPEGIAPFDIILSNPPYVMDAEWGELSPVIQKHEDPGALLSGADGLDCIRQIIHEAPHFLNKNGLLALEMDPRQKEAVERLFLQAGYNAVRFIDDLSGRSRIACARYLEATDSSA